MYLVFSKDNVKEISRKLRDKRGYEFPQLLYNELYDLMVRYEISKKDVETYIHHFTQIIISYLEKNDCYKTLEIYLGELREEEEKNFFDVGRKLDFIIKKIRITELAEEDIENAGDYIAYELKNPSVAESTVSGIRAKINSLVDFPERNELDEDELLAGLGVRKDYYRNYKIYPVFLFAF